MRVFELSRKAVGQGNLSAHAQAPTARRGVVSRSRPVQLPVSRPNVRAAAAETEEPGPVAAAPAEAAAPVSRTAPFRPRQGGGARRPVTVQLETVSVGDVFEGEVARIESFGAFVSFGARTDGLVHISQLTDAYVNSPSDFVKVGDKVNVKVLDLNLAKNRVALSMKGLNRTLDAATGGDAEEPQEEEEEEDGGLVSAYGIVWEGEDEGEDSGDELEVVDETGQLARDFDYIVGKVSSVDPFGAVIDFEANGTAHKGLLSVSEMKAPKAVADALAAAEAGAEDAEGAADDDEEEASSEEFAHDAYVDIGEISDASLVYKVGDEVTAFVLSVEGGNIELTQFTDEELGDVDEVDQELGGDLLEQLDPQDGGADEEDLDDDEESEEVVQVDRGQLAGAAYTTSTRTSQGSTPFFQGRGGELYRPNAFPDKPVRKLSERTLLTASALANAVEDDDEANELEDLWAEDTKIPSNYLKKAGLKFVQAENGSWDIVKREPAAEAAAEPDEDAQAAELMDFMSPLDDIELRQLVKELTAAEGDVAPRPTVRTSSGAVVLALQLQEEAAPASGSSGGGVIAASAVKALRQKTGAGMMDCKKALLETAGDFDLASEWLRKKGLAGADKKASRIATEGVVATYIHPGSRLGVLFEVNCETDFVAASDKFQALVNEIGMVVASTDAVVVSADDVPAEILEKERELEMAKEDLKSKPEAVRAKIVDGRMDKIKRQFALLEQDSLRDPTKKVSEIIKETIAAIGENVQVRRFHKFKLGEGLEKKSNDFAAEVAEQTQKKEAASAPPAPKAAEAPKAEEPKKPLVQVSASLVKELRNKTGAGMMDCKKALGECGGDQQAAQEWLRKKGLAGADKKASRIAAEGVVAGYIHPGSRLGVILEVNCETDFVAASEKFNSLVTGLAMQVAASPSVEYVSAADIPAEVFEREKLVELGREDLKNKPEAIRIKIAEGRVQKIAAELSLLEQPYLMDAGKTVSEAVKEATAAIGEKISVRRFVRFRLGEGLEKKSDDFAAEVAAVTGAKA